MQRRSHDFQRILQSADTLQAALLADSGWLTAHDENQQTLLHHVVQASVHQDKSTVVDICEVLARAPNLNFNAKDKQENTPLHDAAWNVGVDRVADLLLPFLLIRAQHTGYDFSTLGEMGLTVLQIVAKIRCATAATENSPVKEILNTVTNPGMNLLSKEGASAFYYAVTNENFTAAKLLLGAGANPLLCGDHRYDPIAYIQTQISKLLDSSPIRNRTDLQSHERGALLLQQAGRRREYLTLYQMVISNEFVIHFAEIRKNARLLHQAQRSVGLFFSAPDELLIKIAADTASSHIYSSSTAEEIAKKYFNRLMS